MSHMSYLYLWTNVRNFLFTKNLLYESKWQQSLLEESTFKEVSLAIILFQGNIIDGLILVKV